MSDDEAGDESSRSRAEIDFSDPYEARYWSEHFHVAVDELRRAVDKVGSSPTAIRHELGKWRASERASD